MKEIKENYFDGKKVLGKYIQEKKKWKTIGVIGRKNIGKTYWFLQYCIHRFKKYGEKFLIIRRSWKEARSYWNDETANHPLWYGCKYLKGIIFYKDYPMARVVGLTGMGEGRGQANDGYFSAIFDDFIGKKYEPIIFYFIARLAELISNYARNNKPKFRLFMTANNNHGRSEFLNAINFDIDSKKGGIYEMPDINTVFYIESKSTKEGLFALHQTEVLDTAISWTRRDRDTYRFLIENKEQESTIMKVRRSAVADINVMYIIKVKDMFFEFGWSQNIGMYAMKDIQDFDEHSEIAFTFDMNELGQSERVILPPNARQLSKWFLDLLIGAKMRITNLIYLPYFIKNIAQFVKRKDLVWDDDAK